MKKVLLVFVVLAITASSFAQTKFGIKAGVNFANLSGDDVDMDSKTGLVLGAFAKFELSENFAFQPELLYSAQGAKASEEGIDITDKINYLNVPLMAKFYPTSGFSIQAGPQVGFLLSAKEKWEGDGTSIEDDKKDYMKGIDFGLNFGLGYELPMGLGFDLRYNLGLTNIADSDETDIKNRAIQLTASWAF